MPVFAFAPTHYRADPDSRQQRLLRSEFLGW